MDETGNLELQLSVDSQSVPRVVGACVYTVLCSVLWVNAGVPTECRTDVIFMVDSSGSIRSSHYSLMETFISELVAELPIDTAVSRVGLVTFRHRVGRRFYLADHSTVAAVQTAVSNALTNPRGWTRTDRAMRFVRRRMLTTAAGDRSTVPNVVVLLTDGRSTFPRFTQVIST